MHGKNIDETKIERNYSSGSGRDYEENNRSVCRSNNSKSNSKVLSMMEIFTFATALI